MSLYALSNELKEPLYMQIARHLEEAIQAQYDPGQGLPPEAELAEQFGVNRHTLRRGIDELVAKGLVERRHGRGVFVLEAQLDYQLGSATRFTETLSEQGHATSSRVIRKQLLVPSERVLERLGLRRGSKTIWVETLRSVNGRPFCLISHFLDASRYPRVESQYENGSLHEFLNNHYGLKLRRSESLVTAITPQGDDARLLGMPGTRPILRIKSLNVSIDNGLPVEYAVSRLRGDRVELRVNL